MRSNQVAVVGAAETTELGIVPNASQLQLHADAALNAIADAGLKLSDIDGFATAVETPQQVCHYLGIRPTWVDGTSVGGCSFMLHVRHAAAAIEAGLCKTVLITHAESGKSMIGKLPRSTPADSLNGQFEAPYGVYGPPSMFPIPVLRFMKTYGITHEQLAAVAVVQREWAAKNPRAMMKDPITVADVLNSRMIAYPFRLLQCCLVTDGGGALILTSADRARDFPRKPVYIMGTGESVETPMVSQMETFNSSRAFKTAGPLAFKEAGIAHKDVDHLMIYDAFAHLPLFGLGDLGFMPHEETGKFIADGNTRPGAKLPLNTNGGGLSYMHSGMYGMYALQESVRQMRGIAPRRRCRTRRFRCAMASAACSRHRARSCLRTRGNAPSFRGARSANPESRDSGSGASHHPGMTGITGGTHMTKSLQDKVIIVTGAGRGIGREIALLCAAEGAKVVVNDPGVAADGAGSSASPAEEVVEEIKKRGGAAVANFESVAEAIPASKIVKTATDHFGRLDGVVNNAGILRDMIFHKMSVEAFEAVIKVHLMGSFYVSHAAARIFREQESGSFVHFTSTSGLIGNFGQANYAAAKLGIVGLSKSIALDMGRFNVRSNCVSPFAWTRMIGTIPTETEAEKARVEKIKQMGPEKIAPVCAYLLSDAAKDVTGQIFGARMNELFLFSQNRPLRSVHRSEGWTPQSIAEHGMPALKGSFYKLDRSADIFPWDPV
ncbi:NAD(P)-dependent dehydrogenase (short-subunit alcohol dehydrogenase family)/acetyl-CoA acetyltransferase [Bradyrhizobium diazoefficiens]